MDMSDCVYLWTTRAVVSRIVCIPGMYEQSFLGVRPTQANYRSDLKVSVRRLRFTYSSWRLCLVEEE